jgi:hypothetical protein
MLRKLAQVALAILLPLVAVRAQSAGDDSSSASLRFTTGVTAGALHFPDGRTQQGASAVVRWHPASGVSLGVTPSFTHLIQPGALRGASSTGLSDLPVELTLDRTLDVPMSPTVGASLVATLPVGDTASGLGSGSFGSSASLGIGLSPAEKLSLHVGAGRPLSDFAVDGALGGTNSTWGEAEASYQLSDRLEGTFGVDADFSADSGVAPARTFVGGLAFAVKGPLTLTLNAGRGVSGDAARWSVSLGLGTDFASLASLGSTSRVRRAVAALGGQSHSHATGRPTSAGNGHGAP